MSLLRPHGDLGEFVDFAFVHVDLDQAAKESEIRLLMNEWLNQTFPHMDYLAITVVKVNEYEQKYQQQLREAQERGRLIQADPSLTLNQTIDLLYPYDDALLQRIGTCKDALELLEQVSLTHEARRRSSSVISPILIAYGRWTSEFAKRLQQAVEWRAEVKEALDDAVRAVPGRKVDRKSVPFEPEVQEYLQHTAVQQATKRPAFDPLPDYADDSTVHWSTVHHFAGGMSQATLLVGVDPTSRMVKKRMVRKDTVQTPSRWGSAKSWRGSLPNGADMLPTEYISQRLVGGAPGSRFSPKILAEADLRPEDRSYHMLMEYAGNGDLKDVFRNHQRLERPIPEMFLWLVLQALAESAVIMKRGNPDLIGEVREDWMQIAHQDLKPRNVFLDLPNDGHFKRYPRPKVGDFGLALLTTVDDPLNPDYWAATAGTPGFLAPEQYPCADRFTRRSVDDFQLLSHTIVWQIGVIMYNLMTLKDVNLSTQPPHLGTIAEYDLEADLPAGTTYDPILRNMVQRCLSFKPKNRPDVEFLKDWVELRISTDNVLKRASEGEDVSGGTLWHRKEMEKSVISSMFTGALPAQEGAAARRLSY